MEQDSRAEIAQCVYAVVGTEPGARDDAPEFGYTDPTFLLGGVDLAELRAEIEEHEPRADVLTDAELEGVVEDVLVAVGDAA